MAETREREGGISNYEITRKLLTVAVKWLCRVVECRRSVNKDLVCLHDWGIEKLRERIDNEGNTMKTLLITFFIHFFSAHFYIWTMRKT